MYLNDKLFFLREALEAGILWPVRRQLWFRMYKGVLMDSSSNDWDDQEFWGIVLNFKKKCTLLISELGRQEKLEWPMTAVIPGLEALVVKIDDCLQAAAQQLAEDGEIVDLE
ncbi:hypothetical protein HOLleu_33918 [Holothuria leucospilota]|uniref:Uncharacterized protein n=1 Tax=Holothuria leucospilota TaxID=206669 RepID=A0A9Q0YR04_HOLLE|nr:hypothetical protein HOLleu_33918 [Holothuria leucospilota]